MTRLLFLCCFLKYAIGLPIADTVYGPVYGQYRRALGTVYEAYFGLPYALPPTGPRRLTLPQYYNTIFEPKEQDARVPPMMCPQGPLGDQILLEGQSEDCLYLNVFRMNGTIRTDMKSVLVIFHGGEFNRGWSMEQSIRAEALVVTGDIILVTVNYRLGILGFANLGKFGVSNLGFWDQITALRWIHDHIGEFGGNPLEVTVMGTDAGSISISAHIMTSVGMNDKPLFRAAIMDSGVLASSAFLEDSEASYHRISEIARDLNCPTNSSSMIDCLKETGLDDLLRVSRKYVMHNEISRDSFEPTNDGRYVHRTPEQYIELSGYLMRNVRMMIGYALDEGTILAAVENQELPSDQVELLAVFKRLSERCRFPVDFKLGRTRSLISSLYLDPNRNDSFKALAEFQGDGSFKCPLNNFVRSYSQFNKEVYVYRFDRKFKKDYFMMDIKRFGAFHTSPLMHFVGSLFLTEHEVNGWDREFMMDTMTMIAEFVNAKVPPTFRNVTWPNFARTGKVLVLNETVKVEKGFANDYRCKKLFSYSVLDDIVEEPNRDTRLKNIDEL